MNPDTIGALIDAAIPLGCGLYASLIGFRKVGHPPGEDARYDAWHARWGKHMRRLGPAVMLFGVFLALRAVA